MELDGTLDTLREIGGLELALAEFYAAVAHLRPADAEFWRTLEEEERRHAAHIARLGELIAANPDRFQGNRSFNVAAIRSFLAYVEETTRRLQAGEIPADDETRLLALARDMEQSVIEGKYAEVVTTSDLASRGLLRQIVAETVAHKSQIALRLAGGTGG